MLKRNRRILAAILLLPFLVGACATVNLDTKEKKYLAARQEYNLLLEKYLEVQDSVDDETHLKAVEAFEAGDAALDGWEMLLDTNSDVSTDIRAWLKAKSVILKILREVTNG